MMSFMFIIVIPYLIMNVSAHSSAALQNELLGEILLILFRELVTLCIQYCSIALAWFLVKSPNCSSKDENPFPSLLCCESLEASGCLVIPVYCALPSLIPKQTLFSAFPLLSHSLNCPRSWFFPSLCLNGQRKRTVFGFAQIAQL